MIRIVYPERRLVSESVVIGWAKDWLSDNPADNQYFDCDETLSNLSLGTAIRILDSEGLVTFAR